MHTWELLDRYFKRSTEQLPSEFDEIWKVIKVTGMHETDLILERVNLITRPKILLPRSHIQYSIDSGEFVE
jgi:hypothetical protein